MCFNMFTIFEAFTDLKYHFKGHIKAHLRSFRHICTHIEALFFCRHNNTSVAVSINSSFQQIFALLSPKYTQCRNPLALATRLKGAKASSPTVVAAVAKHNGTHTTHTRYTHTVHTHGTHTAHILHTHSTHTAHTPDTHVGSSSSTVDTHSCSSSKYTLAHNKHTQASTNTHGTNTSQH